jgi:hypothetical protein
MVTAAQQQAMSLLTEALACLRQSNPGGALWRCTDAAGLLAEALPLDSTGGFREPTGRGFCLARHIDLADEA